MAIGGTVELGFLEEAAAWRLRSPYFPSKVGGQPAWLGEAGLPGPKELSCRHCCQPCAFLLQVYAPVSGRPECFHRSILVFCCREATCYSPGDSRCFRVFRNQLPRKNETYSYDPPLEEPPLEGPTCVDVQLRSGVPLCRICGCLGPKTCAKCHKAHYCSRDHQILDWKAGHKQYCCRQSDWFSTAVPDHKFLFPTYEIVIEPEEPEKKETQENADSSGKIETCADAVAATVSCMAASLNEEELEAVAKHETKEDKVFEDFKKLIALQPEQVLRYCVGGNPIWISSENVPQEKDIPNCPCGAKRIFEFQIMPQLLNHLKVDSLNQSIDWGTLVIYTCSEHCSCEKKYMEEFLWKQDIVADTV
ncbi:programmed cell death protein 2 [Rhinatrema bivittatum]|uniref:programmed cell death protein 2 n=1 Tax=Rhinatrema bivittatum TaxID=194408 RepID=UPI001128CF6A|nr:programmed cell death protein 2 [Rhinatrema bivittatum]